MGRFMLCGSTGWLYRSMVLSWVCFNLLCFHAEVYRWFCGSGLDGGPICIYFGVLPRHDAHGSIVYTGTRNTTSDIKIGLTLQNTIPNNQVN